MNSYIQKIYSLFNERSRLFIRPELFEIAQVVRNQFGPCEINDWSQGGKENPQDFLNLSGDVKDQFRKESGLRQFDTFTGAKYSMHKYGCAIDLHPL